jgi:hypothetical protein
MSNKPIPNSDSTIESCIAQEDLRQARYSFNIALISTPLSGFLSLLDAGLLLSGNVAPRN